MFDVVYGKWQMTDDRRQMENDRWFDCRQVVLSSTNFVHMKLIKTPAWCPVPHNPNSFPLGNIPGRQQALAVAVSNNCLIKSFHIDRTARQSMSIFEIFLCLIYRWWSHIHCLSVEDFLCFKTKNWDCSLELKSYQCNDACTLYSHPLQNRK